MEAGPIRFVFDEVHAPGEGVRVEIENIGSQPYRHQTVYAARFLSYFDSSGRKFTILPGTHCEIRAEDTIEPGEVRELFTWRLTPKLRSGSRNPDTALDATAAVLVSWPNPRYASVESGKRGRAARGAFNRMVEGLRERERIG